jgi:Reverse transcriptase (RNA-dependent DNA polymerase)
MLALSAQLSLKVSQMDVDTVFLNEDILESILVQLPKETPVPNGDDEVYKLKKLLNGLKQAQQDWNHNFLISKKFERMEADPCIYKKTERETERERERERERVKVYGKEQIKHSLVALYVDDLLVACSITRMCKDLVALFQSEF